MSFTRIRQERLEQVVEAVSATGKLKRRAEIIMKQVVTFASVDFIPELLGLHIEAQPDGFYSIQTPYGNGRGRTELSIGDTGHQAIVHIEKAVCNRLDQTEWHPVWALTVNEKGVFAGSDTENEFAFGPSSDESVYEILRSISYSIAKG
ncbi:hypothetical protein [Stutzerimonas nitrititolerans]|uniref:hypothetical protein n=1 Tax=Stutzerimonas nitrititolerans TaxID=2482751 RepID=UPI0028A79D37|nr:hypothetical protein [Stutzerimonas nitrititolerans]